MATITGKELTEKVAGTVPAKVTIHNLLQGINVKQRIEEILKERSGAFTTSVIQLVNASPQLQSCDPNTVLGACLTAATLDLPINPQLGFAAIVPYGTKAQFQPMWRAFFQLALRTGRYKSIVVKEIYEDELKSYNAITEEIEFTAQEEHKMRSQDNGKVIGYYAMYRLISGFEKFVYMTKDEMTKHGKRYSKSFNNADGKWKTDFDAMGMKTVLKRLLSRYGMLSVEMQKLIETDQAVVGSDGKVDYVDSTNDEILLG